MLNHWKNLIEIYAEAQELWLALGCYGEWTVLVTDAPNLFHLLNTKMILQVKESAIDTLFEAWHMSGTDMISDVASCWQKATGIVSSGYKS